MRSIREKVYIDLKRMSEMLLVGTQKAIKSMVEKQIAKLGRKLSIQVNKPLQSRAEFLPIPNILVSLDCYYKYHRLSGLNNKKFVPHNSEG